MPTYNPERTERVVKLTQRGLTSPEIARMLGVSSRTVQRHRKLAGISQPLPPPFSEDEYRRAQELFEDGASLHEIANTLGRSNTPLLRLFPNYNKWDRQQCAEAGKWGREMARLERKIGKQ